VTSEIISWSSVVSRELSVPEPRAADRLLITRSPDHPMADLWPPTTSH
jgi:hypothetical protein